MVNRFDDQDGLEPLPKHMINLLRSEIHRESLERAAKLVGVDTPGDICPYCGEPAEKGDFAGTCGRECLGIHYQEVLDTPEKLKEYFLLSMAGALISGNFDYAVLHLHALFFKANETGLGELAEFADEVRESVKEPEEVSLDEVDAFAEFFEEMG